MSSAAPTAPPGTRPRGVEAIDTPPEHRGGGRGESLLLAALILVVCAAHLWWIRADVGPASHPNDPYIYAAKTLRFLDDLKAQGLAGLGATISELSFQGRPPLYQLLSLPFVALFGRSMDAMLVVNLLLTALTLLLVYRIGRQVSGGRAGLIAAALTACYPPTVHLTRLYRPHGVIGVVSVLSLAALLRLLRERSPRSAWLFGASLGLGLLFHPGFLWILAVPTVIVGFYVALFQTEPRLPAGLRQAPGWLAGKLRDPLVLRGLLPGAALALVPVLSWYLPEARALFGEAQTYAALADPHVAGFPETPPDFWWYARTAPSVLSIPLAAMALVGLGVALASRRPPLRVLGLTLVGGYAVQSLLWLRVWWYPIGLLPVAALLTGVWIGEIQRAWLRAALTSVCLASAALAFGIVTWGVPPVPRALALALGAPLDSESCLPRNAALCPETPLRESWPVPEILGAVLEDAPDCARGERSCRVFLALRTRPPASLKEEWPGVSEALFHYQATRLWPAARFQFLSPGYGTCRWTSALEYDYLVYFQSTRPRLPDCLTWWERALRRPLLPTLRHYRAIAAFELPGARAGRLVKRLRPLTTLGQLAWASRPEPEPRESQVWPVAQLLRPVLEDAPACALGRRACRVFLALPANPFGPETEEPLLGTAYFVYEAAWAWPRARFVFKAARQSDCNDAALRGSDYVLYVEPARPGRSGCLGAWDRLLAAPVPGSEPEHPLLASLELPGLGRARVLQRREP